MPALSDVTRELPIIGGAGLLLGLSFMLRYCVAAPLHWFSAAALAHLFGLANLSIMLYTLILFVGVLGNPDSGSAGISAHSQWMILVAHLARAGFTLNSAFGKARLNWADAIFSPLCTAALALAINSRVATRFAGRPVRGAVPESFPSGKVTVGLLMVALLAYKEMKWREREAAPNATSWLLLAFAIYMQAAAMLPQRALLLRTRRLPVLTSFAFCLLALGCFLRLIVWIVLMLEGEFHYALMVGDFVHIALQGDFIALCMRALREQGVAATMRDGAMNLHGSEEV